MLEWEWFGDVNTQCVFIYLLLSANIEDKHWQGIEVKRGQLVTSVASIQQGIRGRRRMNTISTQSVRTSLSHLKSTNEITIQTTPNYTIITINKFNDYQEVTNKLTNDQQTTNKRLTTTKEYKKERIKEDKTYTDKKLTLDQVANTVVEAFNVHLGTCFRTSDGFKPNLEYWLNTYQPKEIEKAIQNIKYDEFWNGKMTPTIMFRRKNPQGEPVDYISQLLLVKPKYD